MAAAILTFFTIVSAFLAIRAKYRGPAVRVYVFKPLATVLIWTIAAVSDPSVSTPYQRLVLSGLLFSLAGDVFLMLPQDRFLAGLVSFLIAHLFYIAAFTSGPRTGPTGWIVVPVVCVGAVLGFLLVPHAGRMKIPVFLYTMIILIMLWRAWERWHSTGRTGALLAAAGSVLFVLSDSLLAWNRFRHPFKSVEAIKLSAYFTAQWLIAMSVVDA
jgi:uncharacterized membrane protein YhhN